MKHIAETDRKFIDMGDLKVHHSIFPVVFPPDETNWGSIMKFDDKLILAGKQENQSFRGTGILIVRIIISGTTAYYDSTGYRKILKENDALVVGYGQDLVESTLVNYNETAENEFLEIWVSSESSEKRRHFYPAKTDNHDVLLTHIAISALPHDGIDLNNDRWLWRGMFAAGTRQTLFNPISDDKLILFVLSGTLILNKLKMEYRDTIIIPLKQAMTLLFEKDTDLLIIQMHNYKGKLS